MRRRALTGGLGLTVLVGALLALGSWTAPTVWGDSSGMSWDVYMEAPPGACPAPGGTNDGDVDIETGECPDVESNFWLQPEGGEGGSQAFFDRANVTWTTGPLGPDVTGDTIPDPTDGLIPNRPTTLGAKAGEISLEIHSNLLVGALLQNNIDDVGTMNDSDVTGQPIPCGADIDGNTTVDTLVLQDSFELWNAITDDSNGIVSAVETQQPDPTYPPGCDVTGGTPGAVCAPKGVTMLPAPIPAVETVIGVPSGSLVSRSYGIARLPIVAGISSDIDVNFLVYSLHSIGIDGYLNVTLLQYPGLAPPDPSTPTYNPLAQAIQTCPPYWSSATVYGVTAEPDFDDDSTPDLVVTPELNRLVICPGGSCGPYDYTTHKSTAADYDGDTIPGYADRCDTDPATGSADDDTDGDTLTGTCETTSAGNGEGANPKVDGWNATPPWDTGQAVDGDMYLNYVDNCPIVADADLDGDSVVDYQLDVDGDGVGDLCDLAPLIPGDGTGYAGPPGAYLDRDNHCVDQFSIGQAEPRADGPAAPPGSVGSEAKYCYVAETSQVNYPPPYDVTPNPALYHLDITCKDSNDDGDPDWADLSKNAAYDVGEPIDTDDDSDGDLDTEACEAYSGTDPLDGTDPTPPGGSSGDCDAGGIMDMAEEFEATDPFDDLDDTGTDSDGDGLTDGFETERADTNPNDADSDGGGMDDGLELLLGTDPNDDTDDDSDLDGDLLGNIAELANGTNPKMADSDRDGLGDGLENSLSTNPNVLSDPGLGNIPSPGDSDGDSCANGNDEDPLDPLDNLMWLDGATGTGKVTAGDIGATTAVWNTVHPFRYLDKAVGTGKVTAGDIGAVTATWNTGCP